MRPELIRRAGMIKRPTSRGKNRTTRQEAIETPVVQLRATQNPAQYTAVSALPEQKTAETENGNRSDLPSDSEAYNSLHGPGIAATGLEPVTRGL